MKVGILGTGNVGGALGSGLLRAGHEVRFGSRNPKAAKVPPGTGAVGVKEVPGWADAVILAVPRGAVRDTIASVGPEALEGKTVIDVTNAVGPPPAWAVGSASAAEALAKLVPKARVVKAFNTVFAAQMGTGKLGNQSLTLFVAGDDEAAKKAVLRLGRDLGFDPVDAGPLKSARYLEAMALQLITLGYDLGMGGKIGYRLVRERE